jgi:hypothetical protein
MACFDEELEAAGQDLDLISEPMPCKNAPRMFLRKQRYEREIKELLEQRPPELRSYLISILSKFILAHKNHLVPSYVRRNSTDKDIFKSYAKKIFGQELKSLKEIKKFLKIKHANWEEDQKPWFLRK